LKSYDFIYGGPPSAKLAALNQRDVHVLAALNFDFPSLIGSA
jgi:hypothetical protein